MNERTTGRVIFHVDMNSFYASCEIARHPQWRGLPLAIAGRSEERHGIIVTSSYEARAFGVRTTMTVPEARQLCPQLIVQTPDFDYYRQVSAQFFHYLHRYTDCVEKASIDEGYMDVTQCALDEHPLAFGQRLQREILEKMMLPCSIGIAPNKFLAKMASDMRKPLGLTVLRKRDIQDKMWPLPIGRLIGVGKKTEERMKQTGIYTIGQLAQRSQADVLNRFGHNGEKLRAYANGLDQRPVDPEAWERYQTISHSLTLPQDTRSQQIIDEQLHHLSAKLESKLKQQHVISYELTVTIKYSDWKTVSKRQSVNQPMYTQETIWSVARKLVQKVWRGQLIRLIGLTLSEFQPVTQATKQLDLFHYTEDMRNEKLYMTRDQINARFGSGAIQAASALIQETESKLNSK
ncbi:MAG: DNA polymerase IV [Sporolactobacillus sp.]